MKEFSSQDGGRYTFVDDIVNLQNLALAFSAIFDTCDNFVITGCELVGDTVSDGYVYIDGKIRQFNSGSITVNSSGNRFLCASDTSEQVPYASGGTKVGRTNYGVVLANSIPAPVNGTQPGYISISANGYCKRLKDAFFGKYALLLDPSVSSQAVRGKVSFSDTLKALKDISVNGPIDISMSGGTAKLWFDSNALTLRAIINRKTYKLTMSETGGIQFFVNGTLCMSVKSNGINFSVPVATAKATVGRVEISGNNLYSLNPGTNSGILNINVSGTPAIFQTTNIGDGKGNVLFSVIGSTKSIIANISSFTIAGSTSTGLILKSDKAKVDVDYQKSIFWQDANAETCGFIGYSSAVENFLELKNNIGNVHIVGKESVNLYPAIKENGVLLSEKYVLSTTFTTELQKKVDTDKVYTKTVADGRFSQITKGFAPFVGPTSAAKLREQIGAIGADGLSDYVQKGQFLADMATNDANKAKIRQNIGAAAAGDFQPKLQDSGWKRIGSTNLYARQIGNIVSIQGTIQNIHSGTLFTLPNGIEAPTHDVGFSWNVTYSGSWAGKIAANSRECKVTYCNAHGNTIPFSITYMV